MTLTHGELFAGISGFGLGMERAGIETRWAVEIDPACRRVLAHHHPDAAIHADVCEVGRHNLEPVDIITFGSPCQDLSVAGKRRGLAGERSGLYFEAIRVIAELRPTFAVWENVPGALSSNGGRDFGAAIDALAELGAVDIAWTVLDAQYFGVAQRRRRVFVVADFRGERAGEILALADGLSGHPAPRRATRQDIAGTLGSSAQGGFRTTDLDVSGAFITHALTGEGFDASEDGTGRGTPIIPVAFDLAQVTSAGNYSNPKPGDPCHPLTSAANQSIIAIQDAAMPREKKQNGIGIASDAPMYALDGHGAHAVAFNWSASSHQSMNPHETPSALQTGHPPAVAVMSAMSVRRLTPRECARLQAFPDDWLDLDPPLSDSTKYRMLGNAVCVSVAQWIGQQIARAAQESSLESRSYAANQ